MKRILLGFIGLIAMAGAALADPIEGLWQTEVDDGSYALVRVSPCGAAYCGVIERTFDGTGEYQSENLGRQIIINMAPAGGTDYEGQVWRPSNDKIYIGKITLTGDNMRLRGCVAGGLFCAAQAWTRAN
ncbi:MAG: DUF2147 domain-containing protein [Rhodobacteraceae bacterium]|nr:DUF2147 domain-containing protein [Paracoccaceae bacterium]